MKTPHEGFSLLTTLLHSSAEDIGYQSQNSYLI